MSRTGTVAEDQSGSGGVDRVKAEQPTLFDLSGIDLSASVADRAEIGKINPHRHEMALLDDIVWVNDELTKAVARLRCAEDAFWVRGHFPGLPLMPGVLQVEAGAQVACYIWNRRQPTPKLAAFLRIENAAFRRSVVPGDELFVLCQEVKMGRRRFISDVQGLVNGKVAFEARVSGMAMDGHDHKAE